jgi:dTDP-glucose 4,6-dehydratase
MIRSPCSVLVTGGAGFIGSNFIRYLFGQEDFAARVVNVDKLTYAGNPLNLSEIVTRWDGSRYFMERADICDADRIADIMNRHHVDMIVHLAAESHVDRSIMKPADFVTTNILGTSVLLDVARAQWSGRNDVLFHHVSTDEVFGSLGPVGRFTESSAYDPRSPYSASKASSDHLVRAYHHTFGIPVTISNCSNNYGPYQFPEKLIPLMIMNMIEKKPLPVYGAGTNIRDWLYVDDHSSALYSIITNSRAGETYTIGGESESSNIDLVRLLCRITAEFTGANVESYLGLIRFVMDRPGHDQRYAIDCTKIKSSLGWTQSIGLSDGLRRTVRWYLGNLSWVDSVRSGDYLKWIETNYGTARRISDKSVAG